MNEAVLAAYDRLGADPDKDRHRRHKGRNEHLCIGTGCTTWISDGLPSVLCPGCVITARERAGLQADGNPR